MCGDGCFFLVVLDSSVILQALFEEEYTKEARILLREADIVEVPAILEFEVGSGLTKLHRRKLLSQREAEDYMRQFSGIPLKIVETDRERTLKIAIRTGLTFYDASYVDVALRAESTIYTSDDALFERSKEFTSSFHLREMKDGHHKRERSDRISRSLLGGGGPPRRVFHRRAC